MKIIKSDGRHQMYNQGMRAIMEFNMRENDERNHYWAVRDFLNTMYGPTVNRNAEGRWVQSTEWQHSNRISRNKTRIFVKDIFVKDEAVISYVLLNVPVNTV